MKVLLIILALITIILLIPFGVSAAYLGSALSVDIRIAAFSLRVYPAVETERKRRKKERRERKRQAKQEKKAAETTVAGEPATAEEKRGFIKSLVSDIDRQMIMELISIGLESLRRFRRKLVINRLMLHIVVANDDPYNTAMLYGGIDALLGNLIQLLESGFNIKDRDVQTWASFETTKTEIECEITMTLNLAKLFAIGFTAGFAMLRTLRGARKRSKDARVAEERTINDGSDTKAKQNV